MISLCRVCRDTQARVVSRVPSMSSKSLNFVFSLFNNAKQPCVRLTMLALIKVFKDLYMRMIASRLTKLY